MTESATPQLTKSMGRWSATSIVVGSIIGSSIFMKPATMAAQLGSPWMIILVWIFAGMMSLFGALAFTELGTAFPETGGQYVYLRHAYNDMTGYLYGWAGTFVINTAATAAIAFVLASYAGYFIPLPQFSNAVEHSITIHIPFIGNILPLQNAGVKALAITITLLLTAVNYRSVKSGNIIQLIATVLKVATIMLLIFGILFSGKGDMVHFVRNAPGFQLSGWKLLAGCMAATTGSFAAYDGWCNLNMLAGEIKNPEKNLIRSMVTGVVACIVIYVLITLAYLYVIPVEAMAKSPLVASDAIAVIMGNTGGVVIAILIIISCFGALHINLIAAARVVFAMSENHDFFPAAGKVHPRYQTPGKAVLWIGVWTCCLIVSGSFDLLADMFIFISWIFYALSVAGLFILRKKRPDLKRPYRVWGYPWIPFLFLICTIIYISTNLYTDIHNYRTGASPFINSVFGLALTALGIPMFYYFRRRKKL
jgi:APA family basic amino acid/polyamine antiporter